MCERALTIAKNYTEAHEEWEKAALNLRLPLVVYLLVGRLSSDDDGTAGFR